MQVTPENILLVQARLSRLMGRDLSLAWTNGSDPTQVAPGHQPFTVGDVSQNRTFIYVAGQNVRGLGVSGEVKVGDDIASGEGNEGVIIHHRNPDGRSVLTVELTPE